MFLAQGVVLFEGVVLLGEVCHCGHGQRELPPSLMRMPVFSWVPAEQDVEGSAPQASYLPGCCPVSCHDYNRLNL